MRPIVAAPRTGRRAALQYAAMSVPTAPLPETSAAIHLRRLLTVRAIAIAGLFVTLTFAATRLRLDLPAQTLLATLGAWGMVTLATFWRLLWPWPVRDAELFAQLLVDVAALTVLFYFSGGASNPFVMLYLLPLAFTAAALPGPVTPVADAASAAGARAAATEVASALFAADAVGPVECRAAGGQANKQRDQQARNQADRGQQQRHAKVGNAFH